MAKKRKSKSRRSFFKKAKSYGKKATSGIKGNIKEVIQPVCIGYGYLRNDIMSMAQPLSSKIPINPMWQDNVTGLVLGLGTAMLVNKQAGIDILKSENFLAGVELRQGITPKNNVQNVGVYYYG